MLRLRASLPSLALLVVASRGSVSTAQERPVSPAPQDVTAETLKDPKALDALEAPGTVLFEDGFESNRSLQKYFEIRGIDDGKAQLVSGDGVAHKGQGAIQFTSPAVEGGSSSAGASGWLGKEGHDRVYFRRYIRFAPDYDQGNHHHTGGSLAGVAGESKWAEMGRSAVRPTGEDRFTCAFEPYRDWGSARAPGYMMLYIYWVDMKRSPDGKWWGNTLAPAKDRRIVPPRGRWVCLEQMIQVNTVGKADGELATWIDGELYLHMTGFRWRTSDKVRIKRFDFGIFVHEAKQTNTVWYDDVVLSTGYVGP